MAAAQYRPHTLVWAPIPLLTWLYPPIGHLGICLSDGVILDFAGVGSFLFGAPTRYLQLQPEKAQDGGWDESLARSAALYQTLNYNLWASNCHQYVAHCLNVMGYEGRRTWNLVALCAVLFAHGRFVDTRSAVKTWLPFAATMTLGLAYGGWHFVTGWAAGAAALALWFALYAYAIYDPAVTLLRTPTAKPGAAARSAAEIAEHILGEQPSFGCGSASCRGCKKKEDDDDEHR